MLSVRVGRLLFSLGFLLALADFGRAGPSTRPGLAPPKMATPTARKLPGRLEPAPAGLRDVIAIPTVPETDENDGPDLVRELYRQTLWLTANEEFGLRVRDESLGETWPASLPSDRVFHFYRPDKKAQTLWGLAVGAPDRAEWIYFGLKSDSNPKSIHPRELEAVEKYSRDVLVQCLRAARFEAKPNRRSNATVPKLIAERMASMTELDQFVAVRLLHAEIREHGESDDLVSALSRSYATLGLLTEYQWSPTPAVFHARGLLYAQRLLARSPKSSLALRTRALAFALAGHHNRSLEDLKEADRLATEDKAREPDWLPVLQGYVNFDLDRLDAARVGNDTPFARLLSYLAVEEPSTLVVTTRAANEYLKQNPECYRVQDGLCQCRGVANLHRATRGWNETFLAKTLPSVAKLPGMAKSVGETLDAGMPDETAFFAALDKAGQPSADAGTPSWSTLSTVVRDIRFMGIWYRLYFASHVLGVDTADAARSAATTLGSHPLVPLIQSFEVDFRKEREAALKKLLDPALPKLDLRAMPVLSRVQACDPEESTTRWIQRSSTRQTASYYHEVCPGRMYGYPSFGVNSSIRSPQYASVQAAYLKPAELSATEKQFARHAIVQDALAKRHELDGRVDDAIRCWKQRAKLSPDATAFQRLAAIYLKTGQEAEWLKTLKSSLDADDPGLGHARTRVEIANHYMAKGDFKTAEPFALAAAETRAAWALVCAAECKLGLEKWDEANEIYRACTKRYGTTAIDWYMSCRNSGKMDRHAAVEALREFLGGFVGTIPPALAWPVARFEYLEGSPKVALATLDRISPTEAKLPQVLILQALIADEIGEKAIRDRKLEELSGLPNDPERTFEKWRGSTTRRLRDWLKKGNTPNSAEIEAALKDLAPQDSADAKFFLGWFLWNRGAKDRAAKLWSESLKTKEATNWLKTHARANLERYEQEKDKKRPGM